MTKIMIVPLRLLNTKAVGIVALPAPTVGAHGFQGALCGPAQGCFCQRDISIIGVEVASTSRCNRIGKMLAADVFKCFDDVEYAIAFARAEIDGNTLWRA